MKYLVILALIISSALSAPAPQDIEDQPAGQNSFAQSASNAIQIVRYFFEWYPDNEGYKYT